MSIDKLSQTPAGTTDFTELKKEVTKNAKGINQITLTNYDNDLAPVVTIGSVFENNGATFIVSGTDEIPTGYAGLSVSTTFYLYFHYDTVTPANSEFQYSNTVPVWSDALQGWYNLNDRALFSMFKDSGGTLYQGKSLMGSSIASFQDSTNSVYGSWILNSDGAFIIIPKGRYVFQLATIVSLHTVIRMNNITGGFDTLYIGDPTNAFPSIGGTIFSDGVNFRVVQVGAGTSTTYYRKF